MAEGSSLLQPGWRESRRAVNGVTLHVAEAGLALCDDGRLEFVEGASHWLHLDEPERINRRVLEFLRAGT